MCSNQDNEFTFSTHHEEHIRDYKLQRMLKQKIAESETDKALLKNVFLCCDRVGRIDQFSDTIFTLSNGTQAIYSGVLYCHNPWICPVCSANVMSKWATNITCAIQALKKVNQIPIMITFTIPHVKWFTCRDSMEILINTMTELTYRGKSLPKTKRIKKNGEVQMDHRRSSWRLFCIQNEVQHFIRIMEHTWNYTNGWHPHFHELVWINKDNLQTCDKYEHALQLEWLRLAKKHALLVIAKNHTHLTEKKLKWQLRHIECYYDNCIEGLKQHQQDPSIKCNGEGIHISRDNNNKIMAMESGYYICGWGADNELTQQRRKQAHKNIFSHEYNSYTPYEMLELAKKYIDLNDHTSANNWLNLFMEYARATRKPKRQKIVISRSGLRKIIDDFKQTEEYATILKKKYTGDNKSEIQMWYPVFWFTKKQWSSISMLELNYRISIKAQILQLAVQENNSWTELKSLINQYDTKLAEDIFNNFVRFHNDDYYRKYIFLSLQNRIRLFTEPLKILYENKAA